MGSVVVGQSEKTEEGASLSIVNEENNHWCVEKSRDIFTTKTIFLQFPDFLSLQVKGKRLKYSRRPLLSRLFNLSPLDIRGDNIRCLATSEAAWYLTTGLTDSYPRDIRGNAASSTRPQIRVLATSEATRHLTHTLFYPRPRDIRGNAAESNRSYKSGASVY